MRSTELNLSLEKSVDSMKFRRKRLQQKKHSLLAQLATVSPVTSRDSRQQLHNTPSTSLDTSGEVSLSSLPSSAVLGGQNFGEEKCFDNRSVVREGVDMSLFELSRRNINKNSSETNSLLDTETTNKKKNKKKNKNSTFESNRDSDGVSDGVDMSSHRRSRRNMESDKSLLDTVMKNKKKTSESNRFNEGSDDDSTTTTATVSSQFTMHYPSVKVKDKEPAPWQGGDDTLQIPVEPLNSVPYAHGGYASAAPLMLQDSRWMLILQHLMPDAHEDLMGLLKKPDKSMPRRDSRSDTSKSSRREQNNSTDDPLRVMKWAENNPVVTAFGLTNSENTKPTKVNEKRKKEARPSTGSKGLNEWSNFMSKRPLGQKFESTNKSTGRETVNDDSAENTHPRLPSIEWDVFLDPLLVKYVEQAMVRVDNLSKRDYEATIAAEIEVDRQVSRLLTRMMLAHGSTTQLLAEALGMARGYNFSRVVKASEAVRREIGRKDWSSFTFNCGRNEDSTMDETYIAPSSSVSFSGEASMRPPPPTRSNSFRNSRTGTDARTGGVFAERWLVLFASALRLGMLSEKSIDDMIHGRQRKKRPTRSDAEKSQRQTARFLRGSQRGRSLIDMNAEQSGDIPGIDMLLQNSQTAEDELFIPTPSCGFFLCLGMDDPGATSADHGKSVMAECVKLISQILGEPLRLVLDLKSRNVPPRVCGRLIDNLRAKGLVIDAIVSHDIDELRMIGAHTSTPVTLGIFFFSAGDLQRACHANEIQRGDTVYFNAGSLLWKKPSVCEATGMNCCQEMDLTITLSHSFPDEQNNHKRGGIKFEPYAFLKEEIQRTGFTECKATLADYQKHFDLKIGLYAQEFAIGSNELNALVKLVNDRPSIYNLGLAWGGLNGFATKSVQGDGFWNQRYVGRNWDTTARPTEQMKLLAPEDHHLVQKAILAGQCGQVTTAHRILDGIFDDDLAQNSICENPTYRLS